MAACPASAESRGRCGRPDKGHALYHFPVGLGSLWLFGPRIQPRTLAILRTAGRPARRVPARRVRYSASRWARRSDRRDRESGSSCRVLRRRIREARRPREVARGNRARDIRRTAPAIAHTRRIAARRHGADRLAHRIDGCERHAPRQRSAIERFVDVDQQPPAGLQRAGDLPHGAARGSTV